MRLPLRIDFDEMPVKIGIAAAVVAAIGLTAGGAAWRGWHGKAVVTPIVYFCTETGETFRALPQGVPAVNPKTGRRTLFRGVYCAECKRWYAATTPNHRPGNPKPFYCHVHKTAMTFDGPSLASTEAPTTAP